MRTDYAHLVSEYDWRDDELLPEQTTDDSDNPADSDAEDDLERLRRDVPPHHGD